MTAFKRKVDGKIRNLDARLYAVARALPFPGAA